MNTQVNTPQVSKAMLKVQTTIETLQSKPELTLYEAKRLLGAQYKVESKSLSKLYKELQAMDCKAVLGKSKFPEFKEFAAKLPVKPYYSMYEAINALGKFNIVEKVAAKVARQDKATQAK